MNEAEPHIKEEIDRVYGASPIPHTWRSAPVPQARIKPLDPMLPRVNTDKPDNVVLPKHYARFEIEPVYFIGQNKLNFFQGNVIKYILRHDAKNGTEDVRKAIRYAQMYFEYLSGNKDWAGPDPMVKKRKEQLTAIFDGFRELVRSLTKEGTPERGQLMGGITLMEAKAYGAA